MAIYGLRLESLLHPMLCWLLFSTSFLLSRIASLRLTVLIMAFLAAIFMMVTVMAIDEKKYSDSKPSGVPLKMALKHTLTNRNFLLFIVADFSYFIAITIISSGLMYFVTVLLQLPETIGNKLMIMMVLISFIFYPVVNYVAKRTGKKTMVIFSLGLLSLIFLGIFFLGKPSVNPELKIYVDRICCHTAGIAEYLPNAILAEIVKKTVMIPVSKEADTFAVRYFFVKIAQTFGIALFATFLIYGKDVGNDFGIRLNGILGFGLCVAAAFLSSQNLRKKPMLLNHIVT